jgi:hypothetical protein
MDARPRVSQDWGSLAHWLTGSDSGGGAPSHQSPSPSPSILPAEPAPTTDQTLSSSSEIAFLLHLLPILPDATRSPSAPTTILSFSQLSFGHTITAVIPPTAQVSWHLLADLEVDPWRPCFAPVAELDVAVGCEDTSLRPWIAEQHCRCLPDSPTPRHHHPPCRPLNVPSFAEALHRHDLNLPSQHRISAGAETDRAKQYPDRAFRLDECLVETIILST